jgi:hypothetical protein
MSLTPEVLPWLLEEANKLNGSHDEMIGETVKAAIGVVLKKLGRNG